MPLYSYNHKLYPIHISSSFPFRLRKLIHFPVASDEQNNSSIHCKKKNNLCYTYRKCTATTTKQNRPIHPVEKRAFSMEMAKAVHCLCFANSFSYFHKRDIANANTQNGRNYLPITIAFGRKMEIHLNGIIWPNPMNNSQLFEEKTKLHPHMISRFLSLYLSFPYVSFSLTDFEIYLRKIGIFSHFTGVLMIFSFRDICSAVETEEQAANTESEYSTYKHHLQYLQGKYSGINDVCMWCVCVCWLVFFSVFSSLLFACQIFTVATAFT